MSGSVIFPHGSATKTRRLFRVFVRALDFGSLGNHPIDHGDFRPDSILVL